MNLAAIDLNLLVAFEALMAERHVTRAGQRIGLAQPSMSSALTRLRALFDDELFLRTAQGMQPTPKALALAAPVAEALARIRLMFDPAAFDPARERRRFSIAVTDYGDLVVVPALVAALRREAPGIDLAVRPMVDTGLSLAAVERGEIELAIGGHLPDRRRTVRRRLFAERFVCVRDAGRKAEPLDKAHFLKLPHALFSARGGDEMPAVIDAMLGARGAARRVAVTLPHVVAVPFVVAGTDLVATMAERIARRFARAAGIAVLPLPYPVPAFDIDLVHARDPAPATAWLADLAARVCRDL